MPNAIKNALRPNVIIFIEGGVVHDIYSDARVRVARVDYDVEGMMPEDISKIRLPFGNKLSKKTVKAYVTVSELEGKEKPLEQFFNQKVLQ